MDNIIFKMISTMLLVSTNKNMKLADLSENAFKNNRL